MIATLDDLTSMSQAALDELFRDSSINDIPDGDATGTAIVGPGTGIERPTVYFARWLAWQGKVFDRPRATLLNKVGPFGTHLIRASVYIAPSWFDSKPAIILDYGDTSRVWADVRDEMREVSPGVYLGAMYLRRCPEPRYRR